MGILAFGLWPFNFYSRNRVEWLSNGDGIHFDGYGEAYSRSPWNQHGSTDPDLGVTIELWARSGEKKYHEVSGLFSIIDSSPECFSIGQSGPDVLVRGEFTDGIHHPYVRSIYIDDAFQQGQTRFIALTSGPQGTQLYLDGVPQRRFPVALSKSNFTGRFLLGHNFAGHQPWAGDLLGLAIYDRALNGAEVSDHYTDWQQANVASQEKTQDVAALYLFDELAGDIIHNRAGYAPDITIPQRFTILHKTFLTFWSELEPPNLDVRDIVVNIVGFAPLGFFLSAFLRYGRRREAGRTILLTMIFCGITSLTIEILQAYLPSRESSLLDFMDNTLGGIVGAALECGVTNVLSPFRDGVS